MKKGFTLIELLSVIVILATIAVIVFPTITATIKKTKENLYQTQVDNILVASRKWATENMDELDSSHINATYIDLIVLRKTGFLSADKVKNPLNSEYMNGCIEIKFNEDTNQYNYTYSDLTCLNLTNNSTTHGFILDYLNNKTEVNVLKSAGEYIINNNTSLVEEENEYVFKGSNLKNYIRINSDTYRIMSISKLDYSMKLIRNNHITSSWCDNTTYLCNNTVFNDFLKSKVSNSILENVDLTNNKIEKNVTYGIGIIDDINASVEVLKSLENSVLKTSNIGLISISDFKNSYLLNNSYLNDLFLDKNVWTMSNNSTSQKLIIKSGSVLAHTASATDITYAAYLVIKTKPSLYLVSGTGTSSNAYVVK